MAHEKNIFLDKASAQAAKKIISGIETARAEHSALGIETALDAVSEWYSKIIMDHWTYYAGQLKEAERKSKPFFEYFSFHLWDYHISSLRKALSRRDFQASAGLVDFEKMLPYQGRGTRGELVGTEIHPVAALYSKRVWLDDIFELHKKHFEGNPDYKFNGRTEKINLVSKVIQLALLGENVETLLPSRGVHVFSPDGKVHSEYIR